jgi:putative ABC transport system permease protein
MANRAAVEGFQLFTNSLKGASDWIIEARDGGIPIEDLREIRRTLGGIPASLYPVIELAFYPLRDESPANAAPVRLIGLDLVQVRAIAGMDSASGQSEFWSMMDDPSHLLISKALSEEWKAVKGTRLQASINGREESFNVQGILPEFRDNTPLPRELAVVDLGVLIERLGLDVVDRVELVIPEGDLREQFIDEAHQRLVDAYGDRWYITSPNDKRMDGAAMTAAFRLNLTVLSLVALLVGVFLIAQTLDATVSRRRREIATLRSLGISPKDVYRLWMSEAVLYGLAAALLGLAVGYGLTTFTVEAVTTTVRSLYRETSQTAAHLTGSDILLSFVLGVGGSLIAAWLPARDAASTPPAQFLRLGKRIPPFPIFEHPRIGAGMLLAGLFLAFLPPWNPQPGVNIPAAGYVAAFLWLTGGTLVAAASLKGIGWLIHKAGTHHAPTRLAGSRLGQPTSRHQLALSGFFVAIGMASAMAFLINSFEQTVTQWLQQRLRADLFVSSAGFQGADSGPRMDGLLLDQIEAMPEILSLDRFHSREERVNEVAFSLAGVRFDLIGQQQELLWIDRPDPNEAPPTGTSATAFANENFMRRTGLGKGDILSLTTPSGVKTVWIGGIHADYARDNGLLLIDLPRLKEWYEVKDYETASLFLQPGTDIAVFQARLRDSFPGLSIRQNGELMETALFIFHQTFAVTRALQVIGLLVALAGLALSLLSLLRESGRELSLQRTLGMNRHEISMTTAIEGAGIAFTGLVSGLLLSLALGTLLIYVINRQSFGWTLQVAYPWTDGLLLTAVVLVMGSGISYTTGRLYLRKGKPEAL